MAIRAAVAIYIRMDRRDWAAAERVAARNHGLDVVEFRFVVAVDLCDPNGIASTYLEEIRLTSGI